MPERKKPDTNMDLEGFTRIKLHPMGFVPAIITVILTALVLWFVIGFVIDLFRLDGHLVNTLLVLYVFVASLSTLLNWRKTFYYVGNKQIIMITGIVAPKTTVFTITKDINITIGQSFFGKSFHYGNIELYERYTGDRTRLRTIYHPYEVHKQIMAPLSTESTEEATAIEEPQHSDDTSYDDDDY